jgi:hypothetical protein
VSLERFGYPALGWVLVAAYRKYAWTHLRGVPRPGYPSEGWVTPPSIWTFLSSLAESEFFSSLLDA